MVEWGANYYFKGVLLSNKPSEDISLEKFSRLQEIGSSPDFTVTLMHEFMPHQKINSVPADATPFRRDLPGNALIAIQWKDDTPEKSLKAKEMAHALAESAPKEEPYGNYSGFLIIDVSPCGAVLRSRSS